jgi:hypothetical protein
MVDGAGDHCLPKLYRQPCLFACPVSTQIALHTFAPCKTFNTKTHRSLPTVPEIVHGRCQELRLWLGAVRSAVGLCVLCCYRTIMHRLDTTSASEQASSQFLGQSIIENMLLFAKHV